MCVNSFPIHLLSKNRNILDTDVMRDINERQNHQVCFSKDINKVKVFFLRNYKKNTKHDKFDLILKHS